MPRFAAITRFAETLSLPGIDEKSEHVQAIKIRDTFADCGLIPKVAQRIAEGRATTGKDLKRRIERKDGIDSMRRIWKPRFNRRPAKHG